MASCISNAVSDFCRWNYYFPLSNRIRMVIIRIGIYWYLIQVSWGVPLGARRNGCVRWSIERYKGTLKAASWRWQSSDAKHGKVNPLLSQAPSSTRRHTVLKRKGLWALAWPQQHPCVSHSCWLGGSSLVPQSGVVTNSGNHWEHSGTQPDSAWPVPLARHFRRVPTFLGIFSLKGLDGSPIFLPLTHAFFVLQQLH